MIRAISPLNKIGSMKHNLFDHLFNPCLVGSPNETQFLTKEELLKSASITSRQLRYYTEKGAVSRPVGHTRAAKYTIKHLRQVERVVKLMREHQTSVQEIAEAYAENVPEVKASKQKLHPASSQVQKLLVYKLTSGIRIVANEDLLPTEKRLLQELLKTGKLSTIKRAALASAAATPDNHLLNQVVRSRGRKPSSRSD